MGNQRYIAPNSTIQTKPKQLILKLQGLPPAPTSSGELYDKDLLDAYRRVDAHNRYNWWNYGHYWPLDVHTQAGRDAIASQNRYILSNIKNAGETLISTAAGEAIGSVVKAATTTRKISKGASSTVYSSKASGKVKKYTLKSRQLQHLEQHSVPYLARTNYLGTLPNGLAVQSQTKVTPLTGEKFQSALPTLDKMMAKKGFTVVENPNVPGRVYTNGRYYISDIVDGNVGVNKLSGLYKIIDPIVETPSQYKFSSYYKGGKLINKN